MFVDSTHQAENKLIILYVLNKIKTPLTKEQLCQIILENIQINYLDLNVYIDNLHKDHYINIITHDNKNRYAITNSGQSTLLDFSSHITKYITEILDMYISKNIEKILKDTNIIANYKKMSESNYQVYLKIEENNITLIDLSLNVTSKKQAQIICNNWKENTDKKYSEIINLLV
jgi:predicted transcriptional regulator